MSPFLALMGKELDLEISARDGLPLSIGFSLVCLLSLSFVMAPGQASEPGYVAAGIWVSVLFGASLFFNRSLFRERESGAILALALSPVDPGTIYLAKSLGGWISVMLLQAGITLAAGLFLNAPLALLGLRGMAALALGALGLSALGTLQAAMAVHVRARDAVLPLLLFPLQIPVLILGGRTVEACLSGTADGGGLGSLAALAGFDTLFLSAGYLLFTFLMEE